MTVDRAKTDRDALPRGPATVEPRVRNDDVAADKAARSTSRRGPLSRVIGTAREFAVLCARERLWTAMMVVFVGTWTIELFLVQAATLVYPNDTGPRFAMWAPKIRLVLDLLFVSAVTMSLRRRWLLLSVILSFFLYVGLITYFEYFLKPLSMVTISTSWREGLKIGGFAWDMFPRGAVALLLLALAIQLTALVASRKVSLPRRCAWLVATLLFAGYAAVYATANYLDPLEYIQSTRGVGRLGHIRGYLGPWFAEWYYLHDAQLLNEAVDRRRKVYDLLTPIEADIPIHDRLVIVQAESLDTNILGYKVDGVEVTPFLNRLRESSMYYRVRAIHVHGSCDADFTALNGVAGSSRANTYIISGYPYENTTPQVLANCGYEVYSLHGNTGEFYGRRNAYEKMGFSGIYFREELERRVGLTAGGWGIYDHDTMQHSARLLRQASRPTCHFLITLTTHTPFTVLPPGEHEIFPEPRTIAEHYINNMRYLDDCLADYVTSLGAGTTVVLYADHPTQDFKGFQADRNVGRALEYVPCFIYDSDQDLAEIQKTRDQPVSTDGTLNLIDFINYFRGQVKRHCETRPQQPSTPATLETTPEQAPSGSG